MEFFSKVFTWLANLSSKLPQVDLKAYFIVVLAVIAGVGLIIGLTFFGSRAYKLKSACKKIIKYLANVESIDDDNVGDFTAECFSQKAPAPLRDSWVEYLGVRFGFPSDLVSEKNVYDKEVKKVKDVRANLFIGIALILVAIFAFWGFGMLSSIEMSVVHCAGLLVSAVVYLILVFANRKQIKSTREKFYDMQDELDAKVNFQVEKNFSTDSSPLADLAAMVDEIIARNTAKEINIEEEEQEPTPIEDLIEELENKRKAEEAEEEVAKLIEEPAPQQEPQEEPAKEEVVANDENSAEEEQTEEPAQEEAEPEQAEEPAPEEPIEPKKEEPIALKESIAAAKKAGHAVVGKKFFGEYLKDKYGENVEVNERENKTSTGLPLADTYFALDSENRKCFAYAYEIDGASLLLVNADSELESVLKEKHDNVNLSAFPKSKDEWYSLPLDDTYTEDELKGILDYCYAHALGRELEEAEPAPEEPIEKPVEEPVNETEPEEPQEEPVEEQEEPAQETEEPAEESQEEQPEDESEDGEEGAEEGSEEESSEEEGESEESSEEGEESEDGGEGGEEPVETEDEEPEVVYVVDGEEEEEDYVQPARLSKLSNLTDYMLAQNMSKKVKMQVATMLIGVYNKFKDSPEDKKIIVDCLKKVIFSLQADMKKEPVQLDNQPVHGIEGSAQDALGESKF